MNKLTIALKNNLAYIADITEETDNYILVANINYKLMQLGYILSKEAFTTLANQDALYINNWWKETEKFYKEYLGDEGFKTLSDLVLEGDFFETHWSLLSIWWWRQEWKPVPKDTNKYDFDPSTLKELKYCDENRLKEIFYTLVYSNIPLTEYDNDVLIWFTKNYHRNDLKLEKDIPLKRNMCILVTAGFDVKVNTTTDVLRIAAYMSGLGIDLVLPPKMIKVSSWSTKRVLNPEYVNHKFRKFTKEERFMLFSLLEKVVDLSEMKSREGRWLRLFNMLDPQKYSKIFPKSATAAYLLRNQSTWSALTKNVFKGNYGRTTPIITWKGGLAIEYQKSFLKGLAMHAQKPGEFMRSLDALIRNNSFYTEDILNTLVNNVDGISNKVIFEAISHFEKRRESFDRMVFIPKNQKMHILPSLNPLSNELVDKVVNTLFEALGKKFSKLEYMGTVYINEELKKIPLPTSLKSLGDNLDIVLRGSRLPIPKDVKQFNAYMYWEGSEDFDLSVTFMGETEDVEPIVCTYYELSPIEGVLHSGDIIPGQEGKWAEYVGIDIQKTLDTGFRYATAFISNYTGGKLSDCKAVAGLQAMNALTASKGWLPTKAFASSKLSADQGNIALFILDLKTREWINADIVFDNIPVTMQNSAKEFIKLLIQPPKFSVYSLLELHAKNRGMLVSDMREANTIFLMEDFNKSYTETIKYML